MRLYWQIAKNMWDQAVAYRLSFAIFRLRNLFWILTMYFLWLYVLPQGKVLFGYDQSQILTYILGGAFLSSLIMATRSQDIATEINDGNLSNLLLRPIGFLRYYFARDLGDKAMNIFFSIFELTIVFLILRPNLFLQTNPLLLLLTLIFSLSGTVLFFYFSVLLGFIGFWSTETWGPRFIFYQLLNFLAGTLFPLDIVPKPLYTVISYLPFPYLLYFPMKVYLGQLSTPEIIKGMTVSFAWTIILYVITREVWKRGLRVYTAQGR